MRTPHTEGLAVKPLLLTGVLYLFALQAPPAPTAPLKLLDDHFAGTWTGICTYQKGKKLSKYEVNLVIKTTSAERLDFQETRTFPNSSTNAYQVLLWFDPVTLTAQSKQPLSHFTYRSEGLAEALATGYGTITLREDQTSILRKHFTHHMQLDLTPTTLTIQSGNLYQEGERDQAIWHYQRDTPTVIRR